MINEYAIKSGSIASYASDYFKYIANVLSQIDTSEVEIFIQQLLAARERGSTIYFIGNGGSAATASHFANDIGIGTRATEKSFKAVSLTDNQAVITAIGNDFGYDNIFLKQLELYLDKGDVVVAISASGNSMNLLKAVDYANHRGAITMGLTAFDGGELKKISRLGVHVPCNKGEYGPAEDAHMILDHLAATFLKQYCLDEVSNKEDATVVV